MTPPILHRDWHCPACPAEARTVDAKTPMHPCPGLAGLMAPLVLRGRRAKVEAVERQDYIGRELVQTDGNGRPVMAVVTTRDDGQDCTVFAPTAQGQKE
jgi:NADPH-dependent 2,4-dienoyl-CoA reductase/sulfur reductase-like enzyme